MFKLSEREINLLRSMKAGISKVLIYKGGAFPEYVSFLLGNGNTVTLMAREEYVAPRFEVFPVEVNEKVINRYPEQVIELQARNQPCHIAMLQKSEWDALASEEDKTQIIGEPSGATVQYEGQSVDIPDTAINKTTLHAGIELKDANGWSLLIATSMFPLALYVSDCDFSEPIDRSVYEFVELVS